MHRHTYRRARWIAAVLGQDLILVFVLGALILLRPHGALVVALACAIPVVLLWGAITLHHPSTIDVDDAGIAFHRYGRVHHFAWAGVEAVRVRRFLVRDRVLVRIVPAPPWRGRYWILDGIEGFDTLVAGLEATSREKRAPQDPGTSHR